eukprot:gene3150-3619_t
MVSVRSNEEKHQRLDGAKRVDTVRSSKDPSSTSSVAISSLKPANEATNEINGLTNNHNSEDDESLTTSTTSITSSIDQNTHSPVSSPPASATNGNSNMSGSQNNSDIEAKVSNGPNSSSVDSDVDTADIGDVDDCDSDIRKKPISSQPQPKRIITREKKPEDRKQTRSQSPKGTYGRSVRPGLVQPMVWPASNLPQNWAQFSGYHYPGQARMPAPMALITPYAPAYMPMSGGRDGRVGQSPTHSGSNYMTSHSPHAGEKLSKTNLYIRGLMPNTADEDLVVMCQQYGTIISTKAILDKDTNKCKGYGFVDFDSPYSAQRAVSALQSKGVQAQMARQQEQDPTNLYLSNLPKSIDENQLQQMLSTYGRVISVRILKDAASYSKGVGFARMESKEICQTVIGKLCGQHILGSPEPLLVKFADGGPKKRTQHQDKVWQDNEGAYLAAYEIANTTGSSVNNTGSSRVTAVMPGQMVSYTQGSSGSHYQQQPVTASVGWVPSQPYAVAVSPHVPLSPTSVEPHSIAHVQQNVMPHLTNQMAHMQLPSGGYLTSVPTVAGYAAQNNWHVSQPHTQSHHGQIDESHFIVGSPPENQDGSISHVHGTSGHHMQQHPNEAIIDDHHRVVYTTYPRFNFHH